MLFAFEGKKSTKTTDQTNQPKSCHVQKRNFVLSWQKLPAWRYWAKMRSLRTNKLSKRRALPLFFLKSFRNGQRELFWFSTFACFSLRVPCNPLAVTWQSDQNADTSALNYTTRSCVYLRSYDYKPNFLVLQTWTNTGTYWTNTGKNYQNKLHILLSWRNSKFKLTSN